MTRNSRPKIVILGAGVTGLSAAYRLSKENQFDIHVIDKENVTGGVCRSFTDGDFILDHGPHKFYSLIDGIMDELGSIMGSDLLERDKRQCLYIFGKYFSFPLRMGELLARFPPSKSTKILFSYARQMIHNLLSKEEQNTYEQFIIHRFGKALYHQIFEPMAKKMYGPPDQLDRKLAEVRISSPGLLSIVKQVLIPSKVDKNISAPNFLYPKFGYGMIPRRLEEYARKNGVNFHLGSKLKSIATVDNTISQVIFQDPNGKTHQLHCDFLIYTIPLSALDNLMGNALPTEIRTACRFVNYRHTIIYYFLLQSKPILPCMWVFFPELKYRFGRLSEMVKFSPYTAPPGHTALMVDFTCLDDDPEWSMDDEKLGDFLEGQLANLNLFDKKVLLRRFSRRIRNFYPIYQTGYNDHVQKLRRLEELFPNLFFIGRLGDFNYNNADQCMDMGYRLSEHLLNGHKKIEGWKATRSQYFDRYKIVD